MARALLAGVAIASLVAILPASARSAAALPAGFEEQHVADVSLTTAFAFVPDGRLLIASQLGQLYVQRDGGSPALALDLTSRVCNNVERGLLGIAVDPAFADQHYLYLYYTYRKNGNCGTDPFDASTQPVNRVSRFLLGDNDWIDPASEQVLLDNMPTPTGTHNAGDVQFGKDGYLYVSIGDGYCDYSVPSSCGVWNPAAGKRNVLAGKIARIASDGEIPANNPFLGPGSSRCNVEGRTVEGDSCQEVFATGLRNPFRLAFDQAAPGTRFHINDVGQDNWEEVDLGQPGADYGWNVREGNCAAASATDCGPPPAGMTNPVYSYDHSAGCTSITGGAFVAPSVWPAQYDSHYLYADIVCQKIFDLTPDGSGGFSAAQFATNVQQPLGMRFGPYGSGQALYYASYYPGGVNRIVFSGSANRSPSTVATGTSTNGPVPLTVDFDASQSTDPDLDELAFDWNFGDGSNHGSTAHASHTYETPGVYTATVTVTDGHGGSATATVRVDAGNRAATPSIASPVVGQKFAVGETITLTGSASDPDDGPLPDSALTWEVVKHHATHTHPFLPPTKGNGIEITAPSPEDYSAVGNSYLEVRLTATDSQGLSTTVTRDLLPRLVTLRFETVPAGLRLELNGSAVPASITSWAGWKLQLNAPDQSDAQGQGQVFVSWSDGGAQSHQITSPTADTTYAATFTPNYVRPRGASPLRIPLVPAFRACSEPGTTHGAPLTYGSCAPPHQFSSIATIGTPDANGLPSDSIGFVRLAVIVGNPATTEDEADVRIDSSISDVLDQTRALADYTGQLRLVIGMRLTDKQNGNLGADAGTTRDFGLKATLLCTPSAGTGGSTCRVNTTADSVIPGMVVEGKRAIWEIASASLQDGGSDGLASTVPNGLFARQGVFVP